ncbi:MAG: hypothetical protein ACK4RZ_01880 [Paracoccaceae bacterium]
MTDRIYSHDGIIPVIDPAAFAHHNAVVVGDVLIGLACHDVGPEAVLDVPYQAASPKMLQAA